MILYIDTYFAWVAYFWDNSHHLRHLFVLFKQTLTSASKKLLKCDSCQAQAAVSPPQKKCSKQHVKCLTEFWRAVRLSNRSVEGKGCYFATFESTPGWFKVQSRMTKTLSGVTLMTLMMLRLEVCDVLFLFMWSSRFPTWVYCRGCKDDIHHKA